MQTSSKILPFGVRPGIPPQLRTNEKVPTVATITSFGNGTGVATTVWKAIHGQCILRITDGSASFYDDLAGTINSRTTAIITPSSGNLYVKCSGFKSTLIISDSHNINYLGWGIQASVTNMPQITIDISKFINVEYLRFGAGAASSNVSGSITGKPIYDIWIQGSTNSMITGKLDPKYIQRIYLVRGYNIWGDLTGASKLSYIYAPADGATASKILTITGDIGTWPKTGWTQFLLQQSNEMYGTLDWTGCTFTAFNLGGNNTVIIDFTKIPNTIYQFQVTGNNRTIDYVTRTWPSTMQFFILSPGVGYGLSSAEVDQVLIDLANYNWGGSKEITLTGSNAARTSASDAAVTHLTVVHGCTVTTN